MCRTTPLACCAQNSARMAACMISLASRQATMQMGPFPGTKGVPPTPAAPAAAIHIQATVRHRTCSTGCIAEGTSKMCCTLLALNALCEKASSGMSKLNSPCSGEVHAMLWRLAEGGRLPLMSPADCTFCTLAGGPSSTLTSRYQAAWQHSPASVQTPPAALE